MKIRRPARAKSAAPQARIYRGVALGATPPSGWRGLKRLDWRRWHGLRMRYSHGADPHVVVSARGREWSYPWDVALLDVLRDITAR